MSLRTIHIDFGENLPIKTLTLTKLLYLLICSWFLASKLVARESEDLETLVSILLIKLFHLRVVITCKSSLRSNICDQGASFTCYITKVYQFSVYVSCADLP
jgi:hypothetical protein